jgi:hypothetical protein
MRPRIGMEGTEAGVILSASFQFDIFGNNIHNVQPAFDFIYSIHCLKKIKPPC